MTNQGTSTDRHPPIQIDGTFDKPDVAAITVNRKYFLPSAISEVTLLMIRCSVLQHNIAYRLISSSYHLSYRSSPFATTYEVPVKLRKVCVAVRTATCERYFLFLDGSRTLECCICKSIISSNSRKLINVLYWATGSRDTVLFSSRRLNRRRAVAKLYHWKRIRDFMVFVEQFWYFTVLIFSRPWEIQILPYNVNFEFMRFRFTLFWDYWVWVVPIGYHFSIL